MIPHLLPSQHFLYTLFRKGEPQTPNWVWPPRLLVHVEVKKINPLNTGCKKTVQPLISPHTKVSLWPLTWSAAPLCQWWGVEPVKLFNKLSRPGIFTPRTTFGNTTYWNFYFWNQWYFELPVPDSFSYFVLFYFGEGEERNIEESGFPAGQKSHFPDTSSTLYWVVWICSETSLQLPSLLLSLLHSGALHSPTCRSSQWSFPWRTWKPPCLTYGISAAAWTGFT